MRIAISLPDPLLENANPLAAERGITLSALLQDVLRTTLRPKTGFICSGISPAHCMRKAGEAESGS
jgi:hypothetical protein